MNIKPSLIIKKTFLLSCLFLSFNLIAKTEQETTEYINASSQESNTYRQYTKLLNDDIYTFDNHLTIINGVNQPFSFYKHDINNFDSPTLISQNNTRVTDIVWSDNATKLYGREYESNRILLINPETGISNVVATLNGVLPNQVIQAMTIDNLNTCYVVSVGLGVSTSANLYTCDLTTGVLTLIGSQSQATEIVDMTADCEGNLYAYDAETRKIYFIDESTGTATVLSNETIGSDFSYLTYDRAHSELYMYIRNSASNYSFARINKQTGEKTILSSPVSGGYLGDFKNTCSNISTFQLSPGLNGSWINPATPGQGFLVDILPESNTFFAAWFTYENTAPDPDLSSNIGRPEHRWLTIQGELGEGDSANLTIFNTSGGIFNDSTSVQSAPVGTMTIRFEDCTSGTVDFSFNDNGPSGTFSIQRIASDNIALCESMLSTTQQSP